MAPAAGVCVRLCLCLCLCARTHAHTHTHRVAGYASSGMPVVAFESGVRDVISRENWPVNLGFGCSASRLQVTEVPRVRKRWP